MQWVGTKVGTLRNRFIFSWVYFIKLHFFGLKSYKNSCFLNKNKIKYSLCRDGGVVERARLENLTPRSFCIKNTKFSRFNAYTLCFIGENRLFCAVFW